MKELSYDEFCDRVDEIYRSLPETIKAKVESILIEEEPTEISLSIIATHNLSNLYGFWPSIFPKSFVLCYWGFKNASDFSYERISAVMKHETEHLIKEPLGMSHSEHK